MIRREFRQLEDAWYDAPRIERSKVRVNRLGYFDDVNVETPPVPGTTDQVDVEVSVTEKPTGNLLAGVGYSSAEGIVLNASVSQQNIFGSRQRAVARHQHQQYQPDVLGAVQPAVLHGRRHVAHDRGVRQEPRSHRACHLAVFVRPRSAARSASACRSPRTDTINFGGRFEHTDIDAVQQTARRVYIDFVNAVRQRRPTRTSPRPAGRATPATTSSTRRGAGCRARCVETGLPFGDLPTTRSSTCIRCTGRCTDSLVLMARGDFGYGGGSLRQSAAVLQGLLRRRGQLGARLRYRFARPAGRVRECARRPAARSSATWRRSTRS